MVPQEQVKFYAYLWLREDGTPYYVGKGSGRRAFEKHRIGERPKDSSRISILYRDSEEEAFETEEELIRNWGRIDLGTGCLCNISFGGYGGATGAVRSEEFRRNVSRLKKGNKYCVGKRNSLGHVTSEETRCRMSEANLGNTHTLGRTLSDDHKRKISEYNRNRPQEVLKRISESLRGNRNSLGHKHTEESRFKMSQSRKGKSWTPARRAVEIERKLAKHNTGLSQC